MPEPMTKFTLVTLKDVEEQILEEVGKLGVLHVKRVEGPEFFGFKAEEVKSRQEDEDLYQKLNLLRKRLDVEEFPETGEFRKIPKTELKTYVENSERELNDLLSTLNDEQEKLTELTERQRRLRVLEENKVEVGDLGKFQDKFVKAGLISREVSPNLDKYFVHSASLKYRIGDASPTERFIIISGRREVEEQVTNVLSSFNFREFTFPPASPKETERASQKIVEDIKQVNQKIMSFEKKREEVKREVTEKLTRIEYNLLKKMFQEFGFNVAKMQDLLGFRQDGVDEKKEYEEVYEKFKRLRERLGVEEIPETERRQELSEQEVKNWIERYEREVDKGLSELEDAKKKLRQLEEQKSRLEILSENDIEVGDLSRTRDTFVKAGLINREVTPKLIKYFSNLKYLTYKVTPLSPLDNFIILMGISEVEEWMLNILHLFNFREFTFPPNIPTVNREALNEVEKAREKIKVEIDRLEEDKNQLEHKFIEQVSPVGSRFRDYIRLSTARSLMLQSDNFSVLQGWIPESKVHSVKRLFENVNTEFSNKVTFMMDNPSSEEEPPTRVKTPRIIKPFNILTRMLGTPNYREIDPTVISTVLWVVMFGIMFPDLGQGILISVLGAILAFAVEKNFFGLNLRTVGKLWIGLGVSAAVFGALFGEFFLVENVISPLWLQPLERTNVWLLLKVAIIFGAAQIFLGLTLGSINNLKRGDVVEALFGEHSVAALTLFSGLLILIVRFLTIRTLSSFIHWTTLISLAGLTGILLKSTVKRRIQGGEEGGVLEDVGSGIELFISFLSNTVSYARLAGFCLAHVALAKVTQILMLKNVTLGVTGLVLMNLLALTIELLVVMIQALRLLYYEFSTKFYNGTGIQYNPFILEEGKFKSTP